MPLVTPTNFNTSGSRTMALDTSKRARIVYGLLMLVSALFIVRLFYLQVIRHEHYRQAALSSQLKQYQIPAERGVIYAQNGDGTTPLVLNETKYTLFADPVYVKDAESAAASLAPIIQGDAVTITNLLKTEDTRYVVLAKRLSKEQHEQIMQLDIKGIGTREASYRTYPQGYLASQVLGFVNEDGEGQYGIEQALDDSLKGKNGELRAITDAQGVPLVSNPDNIVTEPKRGEHVTLTLDIGMQRQLEELLKTGLERAKSQSGSAVIMDPNTGAIKAMANYPTYDPSNVGQVTNLSDLANAAVTSPLEVGSIMKSLTVASAIDSGVVSANTSFYNEGFVVVGDHKITDVSASRGTQDVESVLVNSLNTGAVWLLKQIGQGSLNERARLTWYDYMTKHYFLGQVTGIELAGESSGYIPEPAENGAGIDVTYANTSFGQAMTATPLQMAAAFSSIINGGTYYQPTVVASTKDEKGRDVPHEPKIRKSNVVNQSTSKSMVSLLESVVDHNIPSAKRPGYKVGGKTGTAEFINPDNGTYYKDRYNGTYLGFVGGERPEYVVVVLVNEPKIPGYAGYVAAAPLFRDITNMLLDNFGVTPTGQ